MKLVIQNCPCCDPMKAFYQKLDNNNPVYCTKVTNLYIIIPIHYQRYINSVSGNMLGVGAWQIQKHAFKKIKCTFFQLQ